MRLHGSKTNASFCKRIHAASDPIFWTPGGGAGAAISCAAAARRGAAAGRFTKNPYGILIFGILNFAGMFVGYVYPLRDIQISHIPARNQNPPDKSPYGFFR